MKKKGIILSIIGLVLISCLLVVIVSKNSKKYIMQDGVMLALTLDGELISKFPEGTNYHVDIECTNATATWLVEEWKLGLEDITGNVSCNIDFTTRDSDDILINVVTNKSTINANGYRYNGKSPNNYIWFNNEMWRIIGSIPTCLSSGCSSSTNLVKIIRDEPIEELSYDVASYAESVGAWGSNTLFKLLNNYYYGAKDGTDSGYCYGYNSSDKKNCNYTTIGLSNTSYYGKMIRPVFWNTGITSYNVTPEVAYLSEKSIQTVFGYVGLITASDYGFARSSNYYTDTLNTYGPSVKNNWLFNNVMEATSIQTTYSSNSYYILKIGYFGEITTSSSDSGFAVRPVVYLNPNVYVVSGDGSITNPYQVAL